MKKQIIAFAIGAFIVMSMQITAFAAHHACATTPTATCNLKGCNIAETHQHDCVFYTGHTVGDGHAYHQVCNVESCTQTGTHDHDGSTYFEHHNEDGHRRHRRGGHHS